MKSFMAAFWLGNLWILKKLISKLFSKETYRWWLFALSPLVLIETLINGHNDVVMMLPAFISFWFLVKSKKLLDKNWVTSVLFLLLSASIKYATIVLLPFYFFAQLQGLALKLKKIDLPTLFSWVLLAVMFTRPGQMHSWYLIWAFSFSVLSKSKTTLSIFTALSIGALFRYLPYIYFGNWDSPVNLYRQLIWFSSLALTPIIYKKIQPK